MSGHAAPAEPVTIGVDLGATNTKAVVLRGGIVTDRRSSPTHRGEPRRTVAELGRVVADLVRSHDAVAGVGITVPGHCDDDGRATVIPNIPGDWPGTPVRGPVEAASGRPVTIVNDARAFGLAEVRLGAARGARTAVGLVIGTGIGGVVVLDGQVHAGAAGQAGEIGHQVLDPAGPQCGCGNHGCLEALARADVVAEHAGRPTMLEAVRAAEAGDATAQAAITTAAGWIGQGLANVVTVLQPEVVFLGGGVAQAGEVLLDPIRRATARSSPLVPAASYRVVSGDLGAWAGAIGAALAADRLAG